MVSNFFFHQGSRFNSIRRKKYGRIFKTNLIGSNMIRVTGQEYVKEVIKIFKVCKHYFANYLVVCSQIQTLQQKDITFSLFAQIFRN